MGDLSSPTRIRAKAILKIIQDTLSEFGFSENDVIAAFNIDSSGVITNQVTRLIAASTLVVADLSGLNPNVMYELAIRHSTYLPVIQICDDATTLPFDVKQMRTIIYHYDKRINNSFRSDLHNAYKSIVTNPLSANPMKDIIDAESFGELTGLSGIKRIDSVNDMYYQMTDKMNNAKSSVDDITWASTEYYRTRRDLESYEKYKAAMQNVLCKENVKYREISSIAHRGYLWRIEELLKYYNYSVGYYPSTKIPLISYMIIDEHDAFIGFYRDPHLPMDSEVYLHITNKDVLALLIDYYQTLWTVSTKIKEGYSVNHRKLESIRQSFMK